MLAPPPAEFECTLAGCPRMFAAAVTAAELRRCAAREAGPLPKRKRGRPRLRPIRERKPAGPVSPYETAKGIRPEGVDAQFVCFKDPTGLSSSTLNSRELPATC
jgi:hypothetical protein